MERPAAALVVHPARLPRGGRARARLHLRRRHLPGQPVAAVRSAARGAAVGRSTARCASATRRRSAPSSTCPGAAVLSTSPERFLHVSAGGHVETRPIKGTRARGVGPRARRRAGAGAHREREGSRREPDDRRPDAQRPVARLRARLGARLGALRARALRDGASSGLDRRRRARGPATTPSICCAPPFPAGRSPARRSCGRWRSSPSWSRRGGASTAARSATGARPARWTPASPSAPRWSATAAYTSVQGAGSWPTRTPEQEYRETLDKVRATIDALATRLKPACDSMILVLDNRDSFVYNLARYVRERGAEAVVRRSDEMTLDEVAALAPSHIIISPGPCTPHEAGISTDVVRRFGPATPILGVCLGPPVHWRGLRRRRGARRPADARQDVAHRARRVGHLRRRAVAAARRALSLAGDRAGQPAASLRVVARALDDGEIMAVVAPRAPGGRRAVPSRVGRHAPRLRPHRALPARRRTRGSRTCRRAPTAPATSSGAPVWGVPDDERVPFVPPPVEQVR